MPWISIGGALVGGLLSSSAASSAADAQGAAAAEAAKTQKYMYDTTRADQAPFRDAGVAANNRLAMLLGLSPRSSQSSMSPQASGDLRSQLLPQFTTGAVAANMPPGGITGGPNGNSQDQNWTTGSAGTVDEAGLQAEMQRRSAQVGQQSGRDMSGDPAFGSLSRNFQASDLKADPVYQSGLQFGLDQGVQGLNRQAAANGSFLSGAALKALTRFGNDYGNTKANESYNRFNNNQDRTYNKLAGLWGAGQQATNQIGAAGQNMANKVSAAQYGAGDARASGYVGQANAWNNAIGQGVNAYQQNSLLKTMNQGSAYPSSWQAPAFGSGASWSYDK